MTWINIPKEWNGNQALAVVEFLDELSAAIWKVHEAKMLDAWHERATAESEPDDDEMPPDAVYVGSQNSPSTDDEFPFARSHRSD